MSQHRLPHLECTSCNFCDCGGRIIDHDKSNFNEDDFIKDLNLDKYYINQGVIQMTTELRLKLKNRIDEITKELEGLSNTSNQYIQALNNIKQVVHELNGEGKALVKLLSELSQTTDNEEVDKLLKVSEDNKNA